MSKINMFKINVWTFLSQLLSYYAFYFVPNCIRNDHTNLEIDRTLWLYLNYKIKKMICLKSIGQL